MSVDWHLQCLSLYFNVYKKDKRKSEGTYQKSTVHVAHWKTLCDMSTPSILFYFFNHIWIFNLDIFIFLNF